MLEITNVKVYDLNESIMASGYAMMTQPFNRPLECYDESYSEFGKALERCRKLVSAEEMSGISCHSNFLTGVRVSFDVRYPQYWSPEFQRYHFADIVTSSSKMHRLKSMDMEECMNGHVDDRVKDVMKEKVEAYNQATLDPNSTREDREKAFMEMLSNCPLGLELFMRVSTNYKQLRTMYKQRKNHRLPDWRVFCQWIETLPYADDFLIN